MFLLNDFLLFFLLFFNIIYCHFFSFSFFFNINYSVFSSFSYLLSWFWTGHFLSFVLHLFLFHTVLLENYRNKTNNIFWMSNYSFPFSFTFSFFRSSFFLFSYIIFNFCFLSFHFLIIFYFFITIYFPQIRIPLKDSIIGYW